MKHASTVSLAALLALATLAACPSSPSPPRLDGGAADLAPGVNPATLWIDKNVSETRLRLVAALPAPY